MIEIFKKSAYSNPVDLHKVRADFDSFTLGTFRDPPGQVWSDFVHQADEFVVIAEGSVEITVGGQTATCAPGDLVRIPAGTKHCMRTSKEKGSVWFYGYGHFKMFNA